ncbi:mediator-associated protein 1-like [Dorcoceras hygrometricum]|uniref:Mediator-associated protein 1-like n=1 Tax=Dorcoceras hygrometricum TaxID=472368 RepID=A0A2Z7CUS6_9LAMI|nr:mediator-associated protein 1-like [Dorcoceras hygrometricum]
MGNTDPNKTKAGNKYEVKPQYEELSKQINMQHAINQCYECMRAVKGSQSARPVEQPANHIMSPLYHGLSTGKSSVRDHRGPSAHHSSVVDTRIRSTQPPRLVGKERSSQEVSNATKNLKNGGRKQRQIAIENDGEQ